MGDDLKDKREMPMMQYMFALFKGSEKQKSFLQTLPSLFLRLIKMLELILVVKIFSP